MTKNVDKEQMGWQFMHYVGLRPNGRSEEIEYTNNRPETAYTSAWQEGRSPHYYARDSSTNPTAASSLIKGERRLERILHLNFLGKRNHNHVASIAEGLTNAD